MKIGILFVPSTVNDLPGILDSFAGTTHKVQLLLPHDRVDDLDLLLLPDSEGYNLTTLGCTPHMKLPHSGFEAQDQYVEAFRVQSLEFYYRKNTVIVGLGTSACLLYDDLLNGKLTIVKGTLQPFTTDKASFEKSPIPTFVADTLIGMWTIANDAWSLDLLEHALSVRSPASLGLEEGFLIPVE